MATDGLSLVGFMARDAALNHLANQCLPANPDPAVLEAEWKLAQSRLGPPVQNAGKPQILPMPPSHKAHLDQVRATYGLDPVIYQFALIEIAPLLAFQFAIDEIRSGHHCQAIGIRPSLTDILPICLPIQNNLDPIHTNSNGHSFSLKSRNLNFQLVGHGVFSNNVIGIQMGLSLPLAHVVEFNGKYYLHNGFHRTLGVSRLGATHVPCVLRSVGSHSEVGIRHDGLTFDAQLLESSDPPTLEHFTKNRAHPVKIRSISRVITVTWTDYTFADE